MRGGVTIDDLMFTLTKEDIEILTEGDILRIKYTRPALDEKSVVYRGIKRGSFDFAWKIANKFELSKLNAKLDKGLLILQIPYSEAKAPKKIEIN